MTRLLLAALLLVAAPLVGWKLGAYWHATPRAKARR